MSMSFIGLRATTVKSPSDASPVDEIRVRSLLRIRVGYQGSAGLACDYDQSNNLHITLNPSKRVLVSGDARETGRETSCGRWLVGKGGDLASFDSNRHLSKAR
ncbi:hypothetical protein NXS19_002539 [Fusarium pseudograminearum]|nr:hypothetical protein NXS19_002539 [Fusarium pseudograminearum]